MPAWTVHLAVTDESGLFLASRVEEMPDSAAAAYFLPPVGGLPESMIVAHDQDARTVQLADRRVECVPGQPKTLAEAAGLMRRWGWTTEGP